MVRPRLVRVIKPRCFMSDQPGSHTLGHGIRSRTDQLSLAELAIDVTDAATLWPVDGRGFGINARPAPGAGIVGFGLGLWLVGAGQVGLARSEGSPDHGHEEMRRIGHP